MAAAGFQGNFEEDEDEDEQSLGETSSQCATQSAQVAKLTEALAKERERAASRRESSVMLEISEATRSTKPCEAEHAELLALKRRVNHQFDTALHASEGSQLEGRGLQRLLAPEGPRGGSRRGVKLGAAQGAHDKALWGQSRNVSVARLLEQLKQRTEAMQQEAAEVKKLKAELKRQKQQAARPEASRPPNQCQPSSDVVVLPKEFFLADLSRLLLSHAPRLRFGRGFRPRRLYLRPRRQGCGLRSLD